MDNVHYLCRHTAELNIHEHEEEDRERRHDQLLDAQKRQGIDPYKELTIDHFENKDLLTDVCLSLYESGLLNHIVYISHHKPLEGFQIFTEVLNSAINENVNRMISERDGLYDPWLRNMSLKESNEIIADFLSE